VSDMTIKEMLVDMRIFSHEHVSYLWNQYIRGKINTYISEDDNDT